MDWAFFYSFLYFNAGRLYRGQHNRPFSCCKGKRILGFDEKVRTVDEKNDSNRRKYTRRKNGLKRRVVHFQFVPLLPSMQGDCIMGEITAPSPAAAAGKEGVFEENHLARIWRKEQDGWWEGWLKREKIYLMKKWVKKWDCALLYSRFRLMTVFVNEKTWQLFWRQQFLRWCSLGEHEKSKNDRNLNIAKLEKSRKHWRKKWNPIKWRISIESIVASIFTFLLYIAAATIFDVGEEKKKCD